MVEFYHCFQSEWMKKRRSLGAWIIWVGAFFTPAIIIVARLINPGPLPKMYASARFWDLLWKSSWESMALFLLPLGVILATSLITQIEYKNNTWKQVHALPIPFTTLFFSKLAVVLLMIVQFFVLFNMGIFLAAIVPYLVVPGVPFPKQPIPYFLFLHQNALFFIDCLPIIALQYLISLQHKNFLVAVGSGFMLWIGALAALSWKFSYLVPYTYCMLNYLKDNPGGKVILPEVNFHLLSVLYFALFTVIGLFLYACKKEKG